MVVEDGYGEFRRFQNQCDYIWEIPAKWENKKIKGKRESGFGVDRGKDLEDRGNKLGVSLDTVTYRCRPGKAAKGPRLWLHSFIHLNFSYQTN